MTFNLPILLGLLAMLIAQPSATSRESEAERAAKIKAGMILNFVRYTEWPQSCFTSEDGPIIIKVLGESVLSAQVEQTLAGQKVHGRPVEVQFIKYPEPRSGESVVSEEALREFYRKLRESHVLCIWRSEASRLDAVLKELGTSDVLTVSDIDDFAARNGMLGLTVRRERVAFDANQKKIEETKLKVSSQLLRLAQVVSSRGASK